MKLLAIGDRNLINSTCMLITKLILNSSLILLCVSGAKVPIYSQPYLSSIEYSLITTPPFIQSSYSITNWLKNNLTLTVLITGVISGVISGGVNLFAGRKIIELKNQQILNILDAQSVPIKNEQINSLKEQNNIHKTEIEFLKNKLSTQPNIARQLIDVEEFTEKVVIDLKRTIENIRFEGTNKSASDFYLSLKNNEISNLQKQINQLEDSLKILKPINQKFEIYQTVETWINTQLSRGIVEEASKYALDSSSTINSEEFDKFCQSLKKYLKWVSASFKAYAPIQVRKNRLEPVLSVDVYLKAFDYIKRKAYTEISNEASTEISTFLEVLTNQLFYS
ncbi:MAG: hypothetical protein WBF90_11810 [Rivularia sp. (in: cyanobacteria)]